MYTQYGILLCYNIIKCSFILCLYRNVPYMGLFVLTSENLSCFFKKLWYAQNEEAIDYEPMPRTIKTISGGLAGD